MRFLAFFVVILSLISVIKGQGSPQKCSWDGVDYSSFGNATGWSATDQPDQYTYYWNICATAKKCNNLGSGNIVACQVKNPNGAIQPIGLLGQGTFSTKEGETLLNYKNTNANQQCSGGVTRNIDIYLKCGDSLSISQVKEESKCQYGVYMTLPNCGGGGNNGGGSGSKGGIGGGWIFIIILLSCTAAYIIGGVIYNAKVKNLRGAEMLPNRELWGNFGGLIKDGVFFIKSKVTGSPSGYQQV